MTRRLNQPIRVGDIEIRNRLYRAPVLEGAASSRDPVATYQRHFVANAEGGVGLIIQGNTIVTPEGRTSPGMTTVTDRGSMLRFRPMVEAVASRGAAIVIQLGHGGAFALESWTRRAMHERSHRPWMPSQLPWWLRPIHTGVHPLETEEIDALVERFGVVAAWAKEAGYHGVQLAGSNAKLLHAFLTPTYNQRDDAYGGDIERRFEILARIRDAIARTAGPDYPVLLKYTALERSLLGITMPLADGVRIARLAEASGFSALTPVEADVLPNTAICRGEHPSSSFTHPNVAGRLRDAAGDGRAFHTIRLAFALSSKRYPFSPVWNRDIFSAVKEAVSIPVFAVGGIRTPHEAETILEDGDADMIGLGRPFYAEPGLAERFLAASPPPDFGTRCQSCNTCIVPQMLGMPGVCYNPRVNRRRE